MNPSFDVAALIDVVTLVTQASIAAIGLIAALVFVLWNRSRHAAPGQMLPETQMLSCTLSLCMILLAQAGVWNFWGARSGMNVAAPLRFP